MRGWLDEWMVGLLDEWKALLSVRPFRHQSKNPPIQKPIDPSIQIRK
jgi:hypothetical protein